VLARAGDKSMTNLKWRALANDVRGRSTMTATYGRAYYIKSRARRSRLRDDSYCEVLCGGNRLRAGRECECRAGRRWGQAAKNDRLAPIADHLAPASVPITRQSMIWMTLRLDGSTSTT
jgi:hypothetical protein